MVGSTADVVGIKCGKIYLLSDDSFSLICEFCEREFFLLLELRAHLMEHFPKTAQIIIKKEEPYDSDCEILSDNQPDDKPHIICVEDSSGLLDNTNHSEQNNEGRCENTEDIKETFYVTLELSSDENDNEETPKDKDDHLRIITQPSSFHADSDVDDDIATASSVTNAESTQIVIPDSNLQSKPKKPFECHYCSKTFRHKRNCNYHENTHTGKLPQCRLCPKTFETFEKLTDHLRKHKKKDLQCKVCSKPFDTKAKLVAHMRTTHRLAGKHRRSKVACSLCSAKLRPQNLERHIRAHQRKTDIYTCAYCQRQFKNRSIIGQHMRIHSRNPQKCLNCDKIFSRKYDKRLHEKKCLMENVK